MFIRKFNYHNPYSLPDGTTVEEEYELYDDEDEFVSIHYENPDPSLPIEYIVD